MFRRFFILLILLALAVSCFGQNASDVWFDQIHNPMTLASDDGMRICVALRQGLKNGKSADEIAATIPDVPGPRAVFITLGDGIFPGRTYYSAGKSFREAVRLALKNLQANEVEYAKNVAGIIEQRTASLASEAEEVRRTKYVPAAELNEKKAHPGAWDSLRLDIVQATAPAMFTFGKSKFFLSSLCGLAFDANSSFAFTAEQLTGRCIIDRNHRVSVENSMSVISEACNPVALKLWLDMTASTMPFRVTVFETDSYYADGQTSCRMFRGHPIKASPEEMSAPLEMAERIATLLAGKLNDLGRVPKNMFLEWSPEREDGRMSLAIQAELALALLNVGRATGKPEFFASAEAATKPVLRRIRRHAQLPQEQLVAVSLEDLQAGEDILIARNVVTLEDNALTALLLLSLREATGKNVWNEQINGLLEYLKSIQLADGSFVNFCFFDDLKVPLADPITEYGKFNGQALAGLVFLEYAKMNEEQSEEMQMRADLCWRWLRDHMEKVPHIKEAHCNNWVMDFVRAFIRPIPENVGILGRYALAAGRDLNLAPELPDEFGAPKYLASMTIAARRVDFIMDFCTWLASYGKTDEAKFIASDAWPLWAFQQQAEMTPAAASSLPNPRRYLGFCRDNFEDFGFNLRGQVDQIMACLSVHSALTAMGQEKFLPDEGIRRIWNENVRKYDLHPLMASPRLVFTDSFSDVDSVKFSGEAKPNTKKNPKNRKKK